MSGPSIVPFRHRAEAGTVLAERLAALRADPTVVVLGLPRGGVPVARVVADALGAPLDVILVRKLGVPGQPELALGAIGEGDVLVLDEAVLRFARIDPDGVARVERAERAELLRRAVRFRGTSGPVSVARRTAVIVDDGIATGSTAAAACAVVRDLGAARIVLAVPVAPPDWTVRLAGAADEFVAAATPEPFQAVGQFYRDFAQVTDAEVVDALNRDGPHAG